MDHPKIGVGGVGKDVPSHHQANPLDVLQVQHGVPPLPSSIRGLELVPGQLDVSRLLGDELGLPADAALLPAVGRRGSQVVLQSQSISLPVRLVRAPDGHDNSIVVLQIEVQLAQGVLRSKTRTSEGRHVQVSVESGMIGAVHAEVRVAGAAADAIIRRHPGIGRPWPAASHQR